jgi:cell wall assembly regulator SMI1
MGQPDEVRLLFAAYSFGPPCPETDIRRAEAALGESFPLAIRELYLAFDGFRGPTNAAFFWPLFGQEGLVEMNQFYRGDDLFPQELVSKCLFFGDNGCGPQWGIKQDLPGKIIQWDAEWGPDFEVVGDSLLQVWGAEKQLYDSLAGAP